MIHYLKHLTKIADKIMLYNNVTQIATKNLQKKNKIKQSKLNIQILKLNLIKQQLHKFKYCPIKI